MACEACLWLEKDRPRHDKAKDMKRRRAVCDDQWVCLQLSPADGLTFQVPRIPSNAQAPVTASPLVGAARGILTADDLFIWREPTVTHTIFVHLTGIDGLRFRLAHGAISVHQEVIAFPEHFPFVYTDVEVAAEQNPEIRRFVVERWLRSNERIRTIHPAGFSIYWYM